MENLFDIRGRVVVVTGACGVLGSTAVKYFAGQGAKVVLLSRESSADKAQAIISEVEAQGGTAIFVPANVMDLSSTEEARKAILDKFGRIDILLNAVGGNQPGATVPPDKTIYDIDLGALRNVVDLNLFGAIIPALVFSKAMVEQKSGSIINFCSMSSFRPLTRVAGYGVAKTALKGWTETLAEEIAMKFGDGIRVNAIAPGFIISNQNRALLTNPDGSLTARGKSVIEHTPFGRFLEAEELLGTLHYLASDASKAVTGTVAVVDGGFNICSI